MLGSLRVRRLGSDGIRVSIFSHDARKVLTPSEVIV